MYVDDLGDQSAPLVVVAAARSAAAPSAHDLAELKAKWLEARSQTNAGLSYSSITSNPSHFGLSQNGPDVDP